MHQSDLLAPDLSCPGCGHSLKQAPGVIGPRVASCACCGGLWLDQRGYALIDKGAQGAATTLFLDKMVRSHVPGGACAYRARAHREGACPVCAGELSAFNVTGTNILGVGCVDDGVFFARPMARRFLVLTSASQEAPIRALHPDLLSIRYARIGVSLLLSACLMLLAARC